MDQQARLVPRVRLAQLVRQAQAVIVVLTALQDQLVQQGLLVRLAHRVIAVSVALAESADIVVKLAHLDLAALAGILELVDIQD
jgi:argininosuccinate lyase